jgi:catechol 2,3-dioxygenase-like lactoylglutathione lyase family enzyme
MRKRNLLVLLIVCVIGGLLAAGASKSSGAKGDFARTTVDIGVVVSDVEKSAKFYKEALGFTEVSGFDVSAEMAGDSGLTDYKAFKVRVMVLGEEPSATKVKLMDFPGVKSKKVNNKFINSSLGLSYLTLFVSDTTAAVERAKKAGVTPVKEPYQLGKSNNYLTLVKDPDGNNIELVGPLGK